MSPPSDPRHSLRFVHSSVSRILGFVAGVGLAGLALGLAATAPAKAANFRGLGESAAYDQPAVLRLNADGDQLVGSLRPLPVGGALSQTGATWNERTLGVQIVGPAPAPYSAIVATGQETASSGGIRRTIGWAERASSGVFDLWLRTEDPVAATDTTVIVPPYPTPSASMLGDDVSRAGHWLGRSISGSSTTTIFFDPTSSTITEIPDLVARDMDAEGTRVVGSGTANAPSTDAVVWDAATATTTILPPLVGGDSAIALGISASGRIVVGASESSAVAGESPPLEAFRWHPDLGLHALDPIPPGESRVSEALATSDDNIVVGSYRDDASGEDRAFIWTPREGRSDLASYLATRQGLAAELFGWTLMRATAISADGRIIAGEGRNPSGRDESWVVDLTEEDEAELRLRPTNPPTDWDLYLKCGDRPIRELYFGIIPEAAFPFDGFFDFADCTNQTVVGDLDAVDCAGSGSIGPTVSEASYVTLPREIEGDPIATLRAATPYFGLFGRGGENGDTLCEPGDDDVLLGPFQIDSSQWNPELTVSPLAPSIAVDGQGALLPDSEIRLLREPGSGGALLDLRPSLDDADGSRWMLSVTAPNGLSKFVFGVIVPPQGTEVSFGGCLVDLGPQRRRRCADGSLLGSDIDFSTVRTIGPDRGLADFGLRPDALYVYLEGAAQGIGSLPQMNTPGNRARLGLFRFDEQVLSLPGFVPTVTMEGVENFAAAMPGEVFGPCDENGNPLPDVLYTTSHSYTSGPDADADGDLIEDADDKCPYVPSPGNLDGGTLEQVDGATVLVHVGQLDNIGNECQCGDSQNDDTVIALDIDLLRSAIADPSAASSIPSPALRKCNAVGPILETIDPATQLPYDCDLNDVLVLLKARQGLPPLIATPLAFPSCPEVAP